MNRLSCGKAEKKKKQLFCEKSMKMHFGYKICDKAIDRINWKTDVEIYQKIWKRN